ncbi:DUF4406 domain-containing protein [Pseudomonas thivervalensis]|uniref:DUF4406 domain-containing protein n=1 Tax=Pseudomonas thivervalensis TaxID=86265 RepID=UPI003D96BD68
MTAQLRAAGHVVINLAELNPDGGSWHECMRRDIAALIECDTVALLPGWHTSKGARLEAHIAERLGMAIVNADDLITIKIAKIHETLIRQP